jgi:signal transduction histidine kinase
MAVFGFVVLFILGGMAALAFLVTRLFGGDGQTTVIVWIGGIGFALAMPILAISTAVRAFRRIASPLADIMSAADSLAEGDLSARVPEKRGSREFNQLVRSFNRMASELERNDQLRRNLTADVAHELRTPLHIIQGNLEGVLDGVYQPSTDHINATLEETRLLARLVDDLRTLSQAEAGQLELRLEEVELCGILEDVGTSFSGQAESQGIDLRIECADAVYGLSMNLDAGRIDQALSNLVVNAMRHTPEGGAITLRATRNTNGVQITVQDTGEGISSDDLPHIFDRFWRGDRSRTRASGVGGGLGLSITRQLIQSHGGSIEVESALGVGTTFTISLPSRRLSTNE